MNAAKYWILKAKEKTGMNEPQLAEKCKTSKGTINDAKKGRVRIPPHVSKEFCCVL